MRERSDAMRAFTLQRGEAEVFAHAALALKYDDPTVPAPNTQAQLLTARRHEDVRPELWTTFDRVREHLTRGGLTGRCVSGRQQSTRPIQGIAQT